MRKICVVTGTRAEYGLLSRLMRLIADSSDCILQVVATNMHLLPEYGNTYQEIEGDGFYIDVKVPMHKDADNAYGVIHSMSEEMNGMSEAFRKLSPDLVVILGDRYEMLVVAIVAMLQRIPIAHLYGGEISEGAVDDSIRHCITKMSHLHFTSTEENRKRVIQLGEEPNRVFYVGAIGVENMKDIPLLCKVDLEKSLGFSVDDNTIMVTYHPVTLGERNVREEINDFLKAIDFFPQLRVLFTMPNSDQGGDSIKSAIESYCILHADRAKCFTSLGVRRYLSTMQYIAAVVGNSSSGLVEVPSSHIPTLNIGDRQKGRTRGKSVYDCASDTTSIIEGLKIVLSNEFREEARRAVNPYEKGNTAKNIFQVISTYPLENLKQKKFYDIN
ncbi:UDP-N-acetylglucosamine 2-epimerase (hydrolyzing) [Mediterranea sp. An20]|uniref:UDP-N-acetylglucosamine 2-epimerase n=1 Tax=Mediterranea sp. An20 TaxID=1965586 RepID=UPI000B3690D7|nr:UDP-N-acetylglucosamine 2-epimerase [Mediterranea sp. An20]OUP09317.1 UDP-N-acetylglucosamine 2-epimerase (hydrolyzing) [Mediterranea sp. An20]